MILYHGSNFEFPEIDLSLRRPGTDFGKGFYLTPYKEHALARARAKVKAFGGIPIVTRWEYDESRSLGLKVKAFESETVEWAEFVYLNRTDEVAYNEYDIISGPVADDALRLQFNLIQRGVLSIKDLASRLTYTKETMQYCFRTDESLKCLKKI